MILIGASLYLIGVIFFIYRNIGKPYLAFFVLAAAVCHYVAILLAARLSDYKMNSIIKQLRRLELLWVG
jgi:hemolysin III